MKCTQNLHAIVAQSYQLEMNPCSAVGVYISPQIRIYTKRFFAHQLKGKPKKKNTLNFKCTAIFAITIYMPCVFYTAGSHMFVNGSIEDHMFDFLTGYFLPH